MIHSDGDSCLLDFISDDEYDEEEVLRKCSEREELITLADGFPETIIFVGLPIVGREKYNRLVEVVNRSLNKDFAAKRNPTYTQS